MADANNAIIDGAYVLTALSAFIILSRLVVRRIKHEALLVDDYLMVGSLVLYAIFTASVSVSLHNDINLDQKDPGHMDPEQIESVTLGSKWLLAGLPFYMSYLWALKSCFLIYLTRLNLNPIEYLAVMGTGGLLFGTWFGCMLTFFLECRPVHLYWQVVPGAPICAKAPAAAIMLGASDITTHLLIMANAALIAVRSNLALKQYIQVGSLFILSSFVLAVSILRMIIVLDNITMQHRVIWGQIECVTGTILVNAPVIHSAWRHSYSHARRGRFGRADCPPEYTLAVRTATESEVETEPNPSRVATLGNDMRKSIRKISDKVRRSLEIIQIQTSVELLQETQTGRLNEEGQSGERDFFAQISAGPGPVAQIHTHVTTGLEQVRRHSEVERHGRG